MTSAKVEIKELDLSTRVPSFPGVVGGIVIGANKGPLEPFLVTNDTQLLKKYTYDESVNVGEDQAFFSSLAFLEKANRLWVMRAQNGALYGGASIRSFSSAFLSVPLTVGLSDPEAYVFDSGDDAPAVAEVTDVVFSNAATFYDVIGAAKHWLLKSGNDVTDYYVWYDVTDGANSQTDPAPGGTGVKIDILAADLAAAIATKTQAALDLLGDFGATVSTATVTVTAAATGPTTDAANVDAGVAIAVTAQGADAQNTIDEVFILTGTDPGAWNNKLYITIHTYANYPELVKEEGAFLLRIFREGNLNNAVEEFICSRVEGAKDGYGNNIYIEDRLTASEYLSAVDNLAIADTEGPQDVTTPVVLGAGDDGLANTDSQYIAAAGKFANPDDVFVTVIMDGGWATPAYQTFLDSMVSARKDSVSLISVPIADEASATYIADIKTYRNDTLNLNSSYTGMYTPHVKIFDKFNNRNLFVSPDGYAAAAISETASNYEMWYPPAGFKRGLVNVLDLRRRYTIGERDELYDNGINPLRFVPGKGIAIWGQKTLLSRPSALDRMNVRLLLITIEPAIAEALEDFLFDLNEPATRQLATSRVERYMDRIKARKGVTDYQVISDENNNSSEDIDNNRMNVDLYVKPTRSIEYIPFRVIIVSTGVSFDEAAAVVGG